MSSVSSSAASRVVTPTERLLSVGRIADDNPGDAVSPATGAQDPDSDTPPPTDEVVITAEAEVAISAAAADPVASPNLDVADATIPLAPANYNGTPASQAAYAYAQTMQAWLESKAPRPVVRRPAKPNADTGR
jgi:hypothetical protein